MMVVVMVKRIVRGELCEKARVTLLSRDNIKSMNQLLNMVVMSSVQPLTSGSDSQPLPLLRSIQS
jgi:hypothetical protein